MKYLYVLTSDGPGPYARMTALSALSARTWDAAAHVTLLTDPRSYAVLSNDRILLDVVDDVVVAEASNTDARTRSRDLKTTMREQVKGDVLFLDSDTVVCGDLTPIASSTADLSAVADQHRTEPLLPPVEERIYDACGWRRPTRINLNSGVLYWRDTPAAHALSALWRQKWNISRTRTGRHNDQQALNSAVEDGAAVLAELPAAYNAQVGLRPEVAFGAHIWHIFSSNRGRVPMMRTIFDPFWDGTALLDSATLDFLLRRSHPFATRGLIDAAVVAHLARRRTDCNLPFDDWRRLWLGGERSEALVAFGRAGRAALRRTLGAAKRAVLAEFTQ